MKIKILILAISLVVAGNVTAQSMNVEEKAKALVKETPLKADMKLVNDLTDKTAIDLKLGAREKEEVRKVYEVHINALRKAGPDASLETRYRIYEETDAVMKTILTLDQYYKWKLNMPQAYNINDRSILSYP